MLPSFLICMTFPIYNAVGIITNKHMFIEKNSLMEYFAYLSSYLRMREREKTLKWIALVFFFNVMEQYCCVGA